VLRVSHAGNRRSLAFGVEEVWIEDSDRFVPLVLGLRLEGRLPLLLHGEIATVAPMPAEVHPSWSELAVAPELGRAHAAFFDPRYFQRKKQGPTQKYKRLLAQASPTNDAGVRVVAAGPRDVHPSRGVTTATAHGMAREGTTAGLSFYNGVPMTVEFDGHDMLIEADARALDRHSAETLQVWSRAMGDDFVADHRRAIWYFTKYLTPHQPGEPYFFVKPAALFQTPPDWSTLIDGVPGVGYDVLRGVVATDRFHAAPAVVRVNQPCRRVRVDGGAELTRMLPFPRSFLEEDCRLVPWELPR
jgi:hypothetical protein